MQWKHPTSPSTKKFKVTPSPGNIMLTVFWDSQGVLLAHFQKRGEYVNSASYCEVLLKLQDAIRRKYPDHLARGVLLHHDNARPHTARATQERIQELQWEFTAQIWPLVTPAKNPPCWQTFRWRRRGSNEGAKVAKTTVKKLLCCRFQRTYEAIGKLYQC
jgi:hypothetical protein